MDIALKQRLVGASVLIALAVIVLPMLLGGRPEGNTTESQKIEIPRQPSELNFETRRYPIGDNAQVPKPRQQDSEPKPITLPTPDNNEGLPPPPPSLAASPETDVPLDAAVQELPERESPGPVADTVELDSGKPVEVAPEPEPAVAVKAPPAEAGGRYLVQVASFGSINNANRLAGKLKALNYAVLMDSVKSDVGTLHRVRVGPYPSEDAADRAVRSLRTQFSDVKPRVMDMQPEKTAPVTKPSDPLVRWVVQVGSFSSAANADKLVARLRLESLSAYKEAVTSSGSTIYRVRVGPFTERDEAIRVDKLINDRLSLDGVVMSAD